MERKMQNVGGTLTQANVKPARRDTTESETHADPAVMESMVSLIGKYVMLDGLMVYETTDPAGWLTREVETSLPRSIGQIVKSKPVRPFRTPQGLPTIIRYERAHRSEDCTQGPGIATYSITLDVGLKLFLRSDWTERLSHIAETRILQELQENLPYERIVTDRDDASRGTQRSSIWLQPASGTEVDNMSRALEGPVRSPDESDDEFRERIYEVYLARAEGQTESIRETARRIIEDDPDSPYRFMERGNCNEPVMQHRLTQIEISDENLDFVANDLGIPHRGENETHEAYRERVSETFRGRILGQSENPNGKTANDNTAVPQSALDHVASILESDPTPLAAPTMRGQTSYKLFKADWLKAQRGGLCYNEKGIRT